MKTKSVVLFRTSQKGSTLEYTLRPEMAVFLAEQRKEKCFVYKMSHKRDASFCSGGIHPDAGTYTFTRAKTKELVELKQFHLYQDFVYTRKDLGKQVVRTLDKKWKPPSTYGWAKIYALEHTIPEGLYRFKDLKRDDPALIRTVKQFPDLQETLEVAKIPANMEWEIVKLWEPDTTRNNLREAVVDTNRIMRVNVAKDQRYSKKDQKRIAQWRAYS